MSASMDSAAATGGIETLLLQEAKILVWKGYELIKDNSYPIHIHVLSFPFTVSLKVSSFKPLIELLAGAEPEQTPTLAPPAAG